MSWETRSDRRYFYLSVKRNGRVSKRYYGRGIAGAIAAKLIASRKAERINRREAYTKIRDGAETAEQGTAALEQQCKLLTGASLMSMGTHRPQNRQWTFWIDGTRTLQQSEV